MAKKNKRAQKAAKPTPEPVEPAPADDATAQRPAPSLDVDPPSLDASDDDEVAPEAPPSDDRVESLPPPTLIPSFEPAVEENHDEEDQLELRGNDQAGFESVALGQGGGQDMDELEDVEEGMQDVELEEEVEEEAGGDIGFYVRTPPAPSPPAEPVHPVEFEEVAEEEVETVEEPAAVEPTEQGSIAMTEREASEGSASSTAPPDTPSLSGSITESPLTTAASSKVALPASTQSILPSSTIPVAISIAPSHPSPPLARRGSIEPNKHLQSPSKGASIMQKVISMTRQRDLPPKPKEEERKHLRELDEMLAASKEVEIRRASQAELAYNARAAVLAAALPTWETSILPNWRAVLRPDPEGTSLRRLWWEGTMPVRWRGRLWGMTVGNGLAVSRSAYGAALERAKLGVSEGRYPEGVMEALLEEVEETLPALKMFQKGGVMHDDLVDVLLAYSVYWPGVPRHPRGISFAAAMLLVNMTPPDAFLSLVNLVNESFLKSFYSEDTRELEAYHRIFDTLLADTMPKVYANFSQEVVRPSLYLDPWLTTLFVRYLPPDLAFRIFDVFLLEGDSILFRVALVLLQILEPRLFNPNLDELDAVFKGQDRGAVAIVKREKPGEGNVAMDDVYSIMGVSEERVFDLLGKLDWKEETWDRLVARELPEAD